MKLHTERPQTWNRLTKEISSKMLFNQWIELYYKSHEKPAFADCDKFSMIGSSEATIMRHTCVDAIAVETGSNPQVNHEHGYENIIATYC